MRPVLSYFETKPQQKRRGNTFQLHADIWTHLQEPKSSKRQMQPQKSPWDGETSCSTCYRYVSLSPSSSAFLPVCKHTANCHIQLSTFFFSLHVWLHVQRSPSLYFSPLPLPSHLPSFIIWPPILVLCPLSSSHCPLSPAPSLLRPSPSVHLLPSSLHPSFLLSAGRR